MSENRNYDNQVSDGTLLLVGTVVRTLERAVVVFFDGLRRATEHGSPSILGFIAAILPIIAPLPVAWMTAHSLMELQHWDLWQAVTMAGVIEGAGFVLWVSLVETLMADGWKGTIMQFFFACAVSAYEVLLIVLNAILARGSVNGWVILLECLFPALCAIAYGYRNHSNKEAVEREEQEAKEERLRIEQREEENRLRREAREERLEKLRIKNPQTVYAKDTPQTHLKYGGDWRVAKNKMDRTELQSVASMDVETIMATYGVRSKRTAFQWKQNASEMLK